VSYFRSKFNYQSRYFTGRFAGDKKRQNNDRWGLETGFGVAQFSLSGHSDKINLYPLMCRKKLASFVGTQIFDSVRDDAGKCIEMLWKYDAGKCMELPRSNNLNNGFRRRRFKGSEGCYEKKEEKSTRASPEGRASFQ